MENNFKERQPHSKMNLQDDSLTDRHSYKCPTTKRVRFFTFLSTKLSEDEDRLSQKHAITKYANENLVTC